MTNRYPFTRRLADMLKAAPKTDRHFPLWGALAGLCLVALAPTLFAEDDSERWTIQRDSELDGKVRVHQTLFLDLEITGRRVSGSFVETPGLLHHNASFQGSRHAGRGEVLIDLWQTNDRDYHALHIGRLQGDRWVGSWIDNEGHQGDFQLLRGQIGEVVIELEP